MRIFFKVSIKGIDLIVELDTLCCNHSTGLREYCQFIGSLFCDTLEYIKNKYRYEVSGKICKGRLKNNGDAI